MTADERRSIANAALARSRADATEVSVESTRTALTRFTREAVNQNIDVADTTVRVRAVADGRVGIAAANAVDDASLDALVARAHEIALLAPRETIVPAFTTARAVAAPPGAYIAATAGAAPGVRAGIAGAIFGHATGGLWSSGFAMTAARGLTIVTSNGGDVSFDGSDAGVNVKMTASDSTGFAECYARDVTALDGDALGGEAARIARQSHAPVAVEPGEWRVILAPAAFGELLRYLTAHFSAESYDEGASFISGKLGAPVLGSNVTIIDDFAHPLNPGMPFDYEGFPTQSVTLVERGVAAGIVTDATWARRLGRPNTGHALVPPNSQGPQSNHTVVAAGTTPLETLIAQTERGLLVTRLWYVRNVDVRTALLTGMTRDGTFLIENGKIGPGVRNMRFNASIVDALRDCELADTLVRTGGYSYSLVCPAVKFNRFRFASASPY
jgi:predicted Zn-dependent protease